VKFTHGHNEIVARNVVISAITPLLWTPEWEEWQR
jgi:hypothetical protein